jgi:hypothetical protein
VETGAQSPSVEHLVLYGLLKLLLADDPAVTEDPSQDGQGPTSSKGAPF